MDRRSFLMGAVSIPPILAFLSSGAAFADTTAPTRFMQVSQVLMGRTDLSADIAQRIETLLQPRIADYPARLTTLALALAPANLDEKRRNEVLKNLSPADTDFALEIAKPWYLGYVGTPSGSILKDDATFVTYLDAEAYELVHQDLPRTSYPPGGQGWWQAVPAGVTAPPMPTQVVDWNWQPEGASGQIAKADPAWRAYGMGEYASLELARRAQPSAKPARPTGNTAGTATTPKTHP